MHVLDAASVHMYQAKVRILILAFFSRREDLDLICDLVHYLEKSLAFLDQKVPVEPASQLLSFSQVRAGEEEDEKEHVPWLTQWLTQSAVIVIQ